MNTRTLAFVAFAATSAPLTAQTYDPAVSAMREQWTMTAGFLRKAVDQMPESDFNYRPVATVRTFAEIIKHVTATQLSLCSSAIDGHPLTDGTETKATSKADIARELQESMNYCTKAYAQDLRTVGGNPSAASARYFALAHNTAHNDEHYGNIATYMRMKGMVPPSSQR